MRKFNFYTKRLTALMLSFILVVPSIPVYASENPGEISNLEIIETVSDENTEPSEETVTLPEEPSTDSEVQVTENEEKTASPEEITISEGDTEVDAEEVNVIEEEETTDAEVLIDSELSIEPKEISVDTEISNDEADNLGANISGINIDTSVNSSGTGYSYNASTKTLTLNGITTSTPIYYGSEGESSPLKLVINGTNTISPSAVGKGLVLYGETEISGTGTLSIKNAYCGIKMYGNLTQKSGTIEINNSQYGIDVNAAAQTDSEFTFTEDGGTVLVSSTNYPAIQYVNVDIKSGNAKFESATSVTNGYTIYSKYCDVTVSGGSLEAKATSGSNGAIHAGTVNVSSTGILVAEGKTAVYLDAKAGDSTSGTFNINGGKLYLKGSEVAVCGCGASSILNLKNSPDAYLLGGTGALSSIRSAIDSRVTGASADSLEALSSTNSSSFSLYAKAVRLGNGYNPNGQSIEPEKPEDDNNTYSSPISITQTTTDFTKPGITYVASTHTLTIKNLTLTKSISSNLEEGSTLTIVAEGENHINVSGDYARGIEHYNDIVIQGSGSIDFGTTDFSSFGNSKYTVTIDGPEIHSSGKNLVYCKNFVMNSGSIIMADVRDSYSIRATDSVIINGGKINLDVAKLAGGGASYSGILTNEYIQNGGEVKILGFMSSNYSADYSYGSYGAINADKFTIKGGKAYLYGETAVYPRTRDQICKISLEDGTLAAYTRYAGFYNADIDFKGGNIGIYSYRKAIENPGTLTFTNTNLLITGESATTAVKANQYNGEKYLGYGNTLVNPSVDDSEENINKKYDEDTKTLTLKDANLDKCITLGKSGDKDTYTLVLEGENVIKCEEPSVDAITCYGNLVIKGNGKLNIKLSQGDFGIYVIPAGIDAGKLTVESGIISIDVPVCGIKAYSMEMNSGLVNSTISLNDYSDYRAANAVAVSITKDLTVKGGVLTGDSRKVGNDSTGASAITCSEYNQSNGRVVGYGYYSNNSNYNELVSGMNGLAANTITVSGGDLIASGECGIIAHTPGSIIFNGGSITAKGRAIGICANNNITIQFKNANVESFGNQYAAFPINSISVTNKKKLKAGFNSENKKAVTVYSGEQYLLYGSTPTALPEEKEASDTQISTTLTTENTLITYYKNKSNFVYTGNKIKPSITVKYKYSDGTATKYVTLKENIDYMVSTDNDINVGTAKLRVTGIGNFEGDVDAPDYTISKKDIKGVSFEAPIQVAYQDDLQNYLTNNITVYDGNVALEKSQYTLSFANLPTSAPTQIVSVEITANASSDGNYFGTAKKKIKINVLADTLGKEDISTCTLKWGSKTKTSYVYSGKAIKPKVEVYLGDVKQSARNYTLVYENNLHVGKGKVYVVGKGKCYGKSITSLEFDITPKDVNKLKVTSIKNRVFGSNNTQIRPLVKDGNRILSLGSDYTFEYKSQDNEEFFTKLKLIKATYTLTAIDGSDYTGSRDIVVTLVRRNLSNRFTTSVNRNDSCSIYANNGKLSVQVLYNGILLVEGKDYKLTYSGIKPNKYATVTITGIGNYCGSRKIKYKVYK